MTRFGLTVCFATALVVSLASAQNPPPQTPPVPRPFPGTMPPPATPPAKPTQPAGPPAQPPAAPPQTGAAEEHRPGNVPIYPGADFLESFDAGRGQRYFLYGANATFVEIVLYYKGILKQGGGRELFKAPAMQQFDLGRFDEETMAFPPSVVVKDYTWNNAPGYLFVAGTTEKRYKTIIQIVPPK